MNISHQSSSTKQSEDSCVREIRELSRREFIALASASALVATAGCRGEKSMTQRKEASTNELVELSAVDVVAKLRNGEITAERYAAALLEQCQRGRALNAFITLPEERVLEAARAADRLRSSGAKLGGLHGLPIPVKDSVNTKDMPTTGGTPALRNFRPKEDAPVVRALLAAGAIVLGKTNLHELSFGWTSNNLAFGAVHNPYDVQRIPGGSSGRKQRRDGGGSSYANGSARRSGGHGGFNTGASGNVRYRGIPTDHGTI
jgi:indoleacetamide hydrolase